jgi:leader peptidase (prepilin peptidase)/N-methyltransferase
LPAEHWLFAVAAFLYGLVFGSFLNVCIYRLPRGMSVVSPRSACPACGAPVAAYDNIPVVSWFLLGGRCRNCKASISHRYWLIEIGTGLLFLASYLQFGTTFAALKIATFGFLVLGLIFTDADTKLLPDALTLPGLGLGLAFSLFTPVGDVAAGLLQLSISEANQGLSWRLASLADSIIGAVAGALMIWGIGEVYKRVRGVEGMGFGDVKLMAMVGSFLGLKLTVLTLGLGSLCGSLAGLAAMANVFRKRRRRLRAAGVATNAASARALSSARLLMRFYEMPFGVFLGAAALFAAFLGRPLVDWYVGLFP